jgi:hypothetical protein
MTLQAEMPLQATYSILSVERANVHLADGLSACVSPSGDPHMRGTAVN